MSHGLMDLDRPVFGSLTPAWHGLGKVRPGQFETAVEAQREALAWNVLMEGIYTSSGLQVPDAQLTVRDDLPNTDVRRILGLVGGVYTPIQNSAIAELMDCYSAESGVRVETIGSLRNGKLVWILGLAPESFMVKGDRVAQYVLATSGHDGSEVFTIRPTPVRVVCANTLSQAIRGNKSTVRIRHTSAAEKQLLEARYAAQQTAQAFTDSKKNLETLADVKPTAPGVADFLQRLFKEKDGASDRAKNMTREKIMTVAKLYDGAQAGGNHVAVRGTGYGLLNAVGQYADHMQTVRRTGGASVQEARLESVLWGGAADLKERAIDELMSMLDTGELTARNAKDKEIDALMAQWSN